jgi:hypothetical protein
MRLHSNSDMKRPLAHGTGTTDMTRPLRINNLALMVLITAIDMALARTCFGDYLIREVCSSQATQGSSANPCINLSQQLHLVQSPSLKGNSTSNRVIWTSRYPLAMPRLRGTPRRGAAWYAAKSQRKRKALLEAALAIVARRRKRTPPTPLTACVVEEVVPEEGLEDVNMAPWNWQSGTSLNPDTMRQTDSIEAPDYSPCYIIEEAPPEPTVDAANTDQAQQENRVQTEGTNAGEDFTGSNHPPQLPLADWTYLDLVFEIREKLDDQIFRFERMDQRMDMFFAAHSRASAKKQCPTCARPYSFPARWKHTEI